MNRLWVRFSLVIIAVVVFVTLIPPALRFGTRLGLIEQPPFEAEFAEAVAQIPDEVLDQLSNTLLSIFTTYITQTIVIAGVLSIAVGAWLSRGLTAPLQELEEGAEAIAAQQLSYRVPVSGSQEIRSVALAFNQMASQLEEAETLRRNLLADVAHELRNPLHVLQGNLQAILDDVYPLDKAEIARLTDQTTQLTRMVHDLHELAQAEAHQLPLERQEINLAALVRDSAESFRPLARQRHIDLRVELLGKHPYANVDAARIQQVLSNLLANAVRHTPDGGRITVVVSGSAESAPNPTAQITVADSGGGIAPDALPHVFNRFYRTDSARAREHGGSGLGLAIAKAIVEAHGGTIAAASPGIDQGSTLTVQLPRLPNS
jgi:signal transduction histidine kinase